MQIISNMIEAHIFRETGKNIEFLLLKRSQTEIYPGLWQMVTGKIEEGETAYKTALREILEETGLQAEKLWVVPNVNSFYSHESNTISLLPVFAAQVNVKDKVQISREHIEFGWYNPDDARKLLAWESQRHSVDMIVQYHSKDRIFWDFVQLKPH
jgi:dihydroneopterin triphosphate diphosphatase